MNSSASLKQSLFPDFPIAKDAMLEPQSKLYFMGSCFSDEISERFHNLYLPTESNPFGTLFTPQALRKSLEIITQNRPIQLFAHNDTWHFLDGAYRFHHKNEEALQEQISLIADRAYQNLQQSSHLFITLGTAIYYQWQASGDSVANCHKIPQKNFVKKTFSASEIESDLDRISELIQQHFPHLQLVYTVSPVRHLRDGIRENTISKALLQSALHAHLNTHPEHKYFPSFEIFNEELRDLRFFKPDLMHPNDWAINYIFSRLIEVHAHPELQDFLMQAEVQRKQENHLQNFQKATLETDWNWNENRNKLLHSIKKH